MIIKPTIKLTKFHKPIQTIGQTLCIVDGPRSINKMAQQFHHGINAKKAWHMATTNDNGDDDETMMTFVLLAQRYK